MSKLGRLPGDGHLAPPTVEAPRCGVTTTLGSLSSGWSAGGGSCDEDVEGGAGEMARLQRLGQRLLR